MSVSPVFNDHHGDDDGDHCDVDLGYYNVELETMHIF